jgi:hypothetical protein
MGYIEGLKTESEFHRVTPITNGFKIQPANDSPACRDRFNEIVNEAIGYAAAEGYEISHHDSSRDSRGWDMAAFSKID